MLTAVNPCLISITLLQCALFASDETWPTRLTSRLAWCHAALDESFRNRFFVDDVFRVYTVVVQRFFSFSSVVCSRFSFVWSFAEKRERGSCVTLKAFAPYVNIIDAIDSSPYLKRQSKHSIQYSNRSLIHVLYIASDYKRQQSKNRFTDILLFSARPIVSNRPLCISVSIRSYTA